jgi:hypothetical protein
MKWLPIESAPKEGTILAYITGDGQSYMTTICRINDKWYSNHSCQPIEFGKPVLWVPLPWPPEAEETRLA